MKEKSSSRYYTRLINPYILKNIDRYSDRLTNIKENVAEHSFFTTLILDEILVNSCSMDLIALSLSECLRHDVKEAVLTDIPYSTKQYDKEFAKEIEKAENRLSITYEDEFIHHLVKLADVLQVKQFLMHEELLGNKNKDIISMKEQTNVRLSQILDYINENSAEYNLDCLTLQSNVERLISNAFFI